MREVRKLEPQVQRSIIKYLRERICTDDDPRRFGKPLLADMSGLWRYRVGDYRIVCRIEDNEVVILVLAVGHRTKIYE